MRKRWFGKYRGVVVANGDPLGQARLQVQVPAVLGNAVSAWAVPCLPPFAVGVRLLALPEPGTSVWIEFEGGDPLRPIWSGVLPDPARGRPMDPGTPALVIDNGQGAQITLAGPTVSINVGALTVT